MEAEKEGLKDNDPIHKDIREEQEAESKCAIQ